MRRYAENVRDDQQRLDEIMKDLSTLLSNPHLPYSAGKRLEEAIDDLQSVSASLHSTAALIAAGSQALINRGDHP